MKGKGLFRYKGLEKREGGSFTNEKGQVINYAPSYVLKIDEETETGIYERKLKISVDNNELISKIQMLKPYAKIEVSCEISMFGSQVKLVPIDVVELK